MTTPSESTERLKFSDLNGPYEPSITTSRPRGCWLGVIPGVALGLLAIILAVSVGVIVHLSGRSPVSPTVECHCHWPVQADGQEGQKGSQTDGPSVTTQKNELTAAACERLAATTNSCLPLPAHCLPSAPATTSPPPPSRAKLDVRLPLDVVPIHYDVELMPDIYGDDPANFSFSGSVRVRVNVTRPTREIKMHINHLTVDDASVRVVGVTSGAGTPKYVRSSEDPARQFYIVHVAADLVPGEQYLVSMAFTGPLRGDMVGLYLSSYQQDNTTKYLVATQMQPTDARKAFPCWDEPAIKATFGVTLVRRPHMTSLANMPQVSSHDRGDGWIADVYQDTVKMSTYLLAFVVCEYQHKEKSTKTGTLFRVWARPDAINQVDYALDIGVKMLEYFESYFEIPYPLPKQDMIAVPDFAAGAMENWGLILYRETALLFEPQVSSASNKQRVAVVVSHELAHQWFGNLVTMSWWDDLWLNEGFASYAEYLGVEHVHPDWKMMEQFVTTDTQDVFRIDGLGSSHPIYVPVNSPDEINEIFDRISYGKGASVIRMMNNFLGESTFRKGLTRYLRRTEYSNAHHTDLWQALTEQASEDGQPVDIRAIMDTWVLQMGYPVVTLTRTAPNTMAATQNHFLLDPNQPLDFNSTFDYTWEIPLTLASYPEQDWNNTRFHWMHRNNISFSMPASAEWYIGNLGQFGYYRVNYEQDNWDRILEQLKTDYTVIPVKNRAQTLDDAFQLGRAGLLDQLVGLRATEYLYQEREYIPWEAASTTFGFVDSMLSRSEYYGLFKQYMLRHVTPHYERLGFAMDESTPHLQKYLRWTILAYSCQYGIADCLTVSSQLFSAWMDNPANNTIHPDLKSMVYCNAVKNGGEREWDFTYAMFGAANVAAEKNKLMYALSCAKEPWLLSRYLEWTMDPQRIRRQDATFAMVYISRNPIGKALAWDFVRSNWDDIAAAFGAGFYRLTSLISGVTASLNTDFELAQLKHFKETHANLGSGARAFDQAIEKTTSNVKWMKENEKKIGEWLREVMGAR